MISIIYYHYLFQYKSVVFYKKPLFNLSKSDKSVHGEHFCIALCVQNVYNCVQKGVLKMKTICFAQMKGGTGKTTIAFNVSCMLAEKYKVLVVDFDAQCNISSNFCYDIFSEDATTVADLFEDINTNPMDILDPSPLPQLPNLDLFPSTFYLNGTENMLASMSYREQAMKRYMERNSKFFNFYDYIIFDTGPNMGAINQNAFFIADHIILVADPDCNSAQGSDVFLKLLEQATQYSDKKYNVDGLVINNMERTKMSGKMTQYVDNHDVLSKIRFNTTIPHTTRFKECVDQNLPIQFLNVKRQEEESRKRAEDAIVNLIREMNERGIL